MCALAAKPRNAAKDARTSIQDGDQRESKLCSPQDLENRGLGEGLLQPPELDTSRLRRRKSGSHPPEMEPVKQVIRSDAVKLAWCVFGVVGTLILYGILQERIIKQPYGEGEFFKHSLFIVLCNRLLTCIVAALILLVQGKSMAPVAPMHSYAAVSLSNVIATGCQYEALKYVSFPVQTLAKSAKMIPVMLWGTAIMQKKYGARDYVIAVLVTLGCAIFVLYGGKKPHKEVDSSFWGIVLMLGYLGFDGFTSTFQDKLFKGYNMETFNQILYVSICSLVLSLLGLRQNLLDAIDFVARHPDCMMHIFVLSAAATVSQFFISFTIKTFGALVFATIMTTRQLLSIVLSAIVYGPPLTLGQYCGTGIVFSSLYYKSYAGHDKKAKGGGKGAGKDSGEGDSKESDPLISKKGDSLGDHKDGGLKQGP